MIKDIKQDTTYLYSILNHANMVHNLPEGADTAQALLSQI